MKLSRGQKYDMEFDVHRIALYSTVAREHQHKSKKQRLYLHLDMNCFYAQVEQKAFNLYGLPIAMGGWRRPDGTPRGIVVTASYEARQLGIKTAMSAFEAYQICPYIIFLQVDYEKYRGISRRLREILDDFSPEIEKYSLDEYFLDVSFLLGRSSDEIHTFVVKLKAAIYDDLGLVCSVGVAYSKTYAKLASGLKKPNGHVLVLHPDDTAQHLFPLQLDEVWGIGKRRFMKLEGQGIRTIADAFKIGVVPFKKLFGEMQGKLFYEIVTGRDKAKILDVENYVPDEVSYMHTFSDWAVVLDEIEGELVKAVRRVCYRMRGYQRKAKKWSCHIRYQDTTWQGDTFVFTTSGYTNLDKYVRDELLPEAMHRVRVAIKNGHKIRGIGLSTVNMVQIDQLELFFQEEDRIRRLSRAADCVNNVYGVDTVDYAAARNGVKGKTHFVDRK
ncbi:DNA polymerase IV [bacterium]|nr:MAG: DNA polymerase IV [bacterium]